MVGKAFLKFSSFSKCVQIAFPRPVAVTRRGDVASRSAASGICGTWYEIIPFWIIIAGMIGLTDIQLKIVMNAARSIPVEKRDIFLQRIAAMLALRGRGRFTDTDVADVAQLALAGLVQSADSAA